MRATRRGRGFPRFGGVLVAVLVAFGAFAALPADAATDPGDPYAADPLRLVAHAEQGRFYTAGEDIWEVWACDVPDGSVPVDPAAVAALLDDELGPYFSWISEGRYVPRFVVGGTATATSPSGWPQSPFTRQVECEQRVAAGSSGGAAGAIVVVDAAYGGGYGTPGMTCAVVSSCVSIFPGNGRVLVVGAQAVAASGRLRTVAHEIGHGISFPHSFGGVLTFLGGTVYEYDNPMDVMSGGNADSLDIGTLALNRYAAGWIDPSAAVFHRGGTATYLLSATSGTRFLILPTDEGDGVFEILAPRVRSGFDGGILAEGIEVYRVDQRGPACGLAAGDVCWGLSRRTIPVPPGSSPTSTAHVYGVGRTFTVRGVSVEVLAGAGDGFTVSVAGRAVSDRFVDDAGLHEASIELIADEGITLGCNPPRNDLYCPSRGVTRAEMAAFLLRAMKEPTPTAVPIGLFPDVPVNAWYAPYVERLAALGVTAGYTDGTFGPGRVVSRAEMAVFLTRAVPGVPAVSSPAGIFADVDSAAWYAPAVEGLAAAGVTAGCRAAPLAYCPADPVLRDQMATFLARSLG